MLDRKSRLVVLLLALMFALSTVSIGAFAQDWPMFRADLEHTGTTVASAPILGVLNWEYTTGGVVHSSPAVVGGMVYIGSNNGKVYCLDAATGAMNWEYQTGSLAYSSPAVVGGMVYIGSNDNNVYCLDAETGAKNWEYDTGSYVGSSPAVVGGMVYIGSYNHKVYSLDADTGAKNWEYTTGGIVYSSPAVVGGMVYIGSIDGKVYCLDAATGALNWEYQTGSPVYSSPAVANGKVYIGSDDYKVYCLDAETGAKNWEYTAGSVVVSSPAVMGNSVYIGSYDGKVYCLDATTGALNWEYTTGSGTVSSPAVVGDMVYIGSNDKKVYCLDAETGAKNWEYTTGGTIESSPAVADGKVYIGSFDGKVYSFKSAPLSFQFGARLGVEVVEGVSISVDGTWQSTQFSVDLEPGWHRFAADGAIKIESTVYQFSHWENQEGTNINTNRVYWKNIQETSSLYTVYTPRTSTISLTILDISELPLFEVTVTLDGEPVGLSDINGELTVPGVPDGVHVLNVELEGYQSRCKWVWVVRDRTVSLTLLDNPVVHIEAALNENPIECGVRVDDVWYSNPVDLSLSAGWHRFTPTTRKWVGGEVYSFLHWTDDEGNVLSTRLWYWRKIVADETIVAIYE